ncbi:MAG: transporter [Sphingomonadaceae bacterium]|nr:transporter [Sphingomonadaceae bacterium]
MSTEPMERSVLGTLGCAVSLTALAISTQAHAADDPQISAERPKDALKPFDLAYGGAVDERHADRNGPPQKTPRADSTAEQLTLIAAELRAQRELIAKQSEIIARQQLAIDMLTQRQLAGSDLSELRAAGLATAMQGIAPVSQETTQMMPDAPVGEAPPPEPTVQSRVEAVPEGQGVLTPAGRMVLDSSFEYTSSSTNRLVFRGIELVPGIQIGLIEASDADRTTLITTLGARYGLTNRLELEARLPALYRWDRIEVAQQRDEGIVRTIALKERDIGDLEFALRYQLNRPRGQNPIWVANLRVKSDTGKSPFEVGYDEFGVATGLSTGSGFWAVQPGISMLLPSDPAVIFGSLGYLYHIPRNIDREIGGAFIGRVDPGDAISGNLGFGFALNPRFSFSMGYRHSYIMPSTQEIGGSVERSNRAHVGSFTFGMSYRLSQRQSVNFGFEFGATADAPDVSVTVRFPLSINLRK